MLFTAEDPPAKQKCFMRRQRAPTAIPVDRHQPPDRPYKLTRRAITKGVRRLAHPMIADYENVTNAHISGATGRYLRSASPGGWRRCQRAAAARTTASM
jgi:hypothetical protein